MDNLFDEIEKVSASTEAVVVKIQPKFSEQAVYIPLSYQIFHTDNNEPTGKKEIVDTYMCDRIKGIVPNQKAIKKANLMKLAFKTKVFFVEAEYNVLDNNKSVNYLETIYQTK